MVSSRKFLINPFNPQPELVLEAAQSIKKGGIVLFPTKCLYGLGADVFNPDAVDRIFRIKQRPYNKPISVLVKDINELRILVKHVPPTAKCIMDNFWPGQITIVFEAKSTISVKITAGTGKIGIRMPEHPVALSLVKEVNSPITGTSANISGKVGCSAISDLDVQIADKIDMILDAGPLKGGAGSTVIDVTTPFPTILREGYVSAKHIIAALEKSNFIDNSR
ncbi:MAG: threonylcarbamoyl-AMP synthase [Proteobacteria bacterium]|nr:threonylcarbamoyl-AMP synthase [Pseudomonadota bacterium]